MLWLEELEHETRTRNLVEAIHGQETTPFSEVRLKFDEWLVSEPEEADKRLKLLLLR